MLVLRAPSLWDPPWVNDEGTYFSVAQAMAHGYRLYADVWENKPPLVYLLYNAVYHAVGPSLVVIRVCSGIAALASVCFTYMLAKRFSRPDSASFSAALCSILLAVPVLEATTGNAEIFLAAFSAASVTAALTFRRYATAGVLMALAVLFKVVAGFDALALALALVQGKCGPRRATKYGAALVISLLVCALHAARFGILSPMIKDAFLYDLGYVGRGNGSAFPVLLLVKIGLLFVLTLVLYGRPFPELWLAYAAAGALVSGRPFGHYAIQAFVPLSLTIGMRVPPGWYRAPLRRLSLLYLGGALASALVGWGLATSGHDSILARRLQYYANFARYATGSESYAMYRAQIDDHVNRNIEVAAHVRMLPPGRLLVWGNRPWIYVLSRRLPATAYTSALRTPEVPGETQALRRAVRRVAPGVVVVVPPAAPPLGVAAGALAQRYRLTRYVGDVAVYVSRAPPLMRR